MSEYDQWRTSCPKCGHETLLVSEVVLCATGETLYPYSELCGDGFDVDPRSELPDSIKDQSTENEKVTCPKCKAEFDLGDLTLGVFNGPSASAG
jgi:ssDNA-binding Zn-finger/Zn-ribbon topoisomerase 1